MNPFDFLCLLLVYFPSLDTSCLHVWQHKQFETCFLLERKKHNKGIYCSQDTEGIERTKDVNDDADSMSNSMGFHLDYFPLLPPLVISSFSGGNICVMPSFMSYSFLDVLCFSFLPLLRWPLYSFFLYHCHDCHIHSLLENRTHVLLCRRRTSISTSFIPSGQVTLFSPNKVSKGQWRRPEFRSTKSTNKTQVPLMTTHTQFLMGRIFSS